MVAKLGPPRRRRAALPAGRRWLWAVSGLLRNLKFFSLKIRKQKYMVTDWLEYRPAPAACRHDVTSSDLAIAMAAAKKKAGKKDIDDGEEALQAILLADSFRKRMTPITYTTPKSLLPLVNVPILEYTLELLVSAGVKELFIVCCCHAEKIQEYVENSASCKQFQVSIIVAPACKSVGAAMREVDSRGKIRGDFILVNGDVVSNMKLEPALLAHKKRREEEKNKDAILTMVFKTVHPSHKTSLFPEVNSTVSPGTARRS